MDLIQLEWSKALSVGDVASLSQIVDELRTDPSPASQALVARTLGAIAQMESRYWSAMDHLTVALALYEELGDVSSQGYVLTNMGNAYGRLGRLEEAHQHHVRAIALLESVQNRMGFAQASLNLGNVLKDMGDYSGALMLYERALDVSRQENNVPTIAKCHICIGVVYSRIGDLPSALQHYENGLDLQRSLGDREGVARAINNIGIIHQGAGDYQRAQKMFNEALALHQETNNLSGIASACGNIGALLAETGRAEDALPYFERKLDIYRGLDNLAGVASGYGDLATVRLDLGMVSEAEDILQRQADMNMADPWTLVEYFVNRGRIDEARGNTDAASVNFEQALAIATDTGVKQASVDVLLRLRGLAQKRNDLASYVRYNDDYVRLSEEIRGKEATQRLAVMDFERKMAEERRERDRERALLFGALPQQVAERMVRGEDVSGYHFDNASVLFLDIVGFTRISAGISPHRVVQFLKMIFKICDAVSAEFGLTKIKTIGDSYMAVCGVPESLDDHVDRTAMSALAMVQRLERLPLQVDPVDNDTSWVKDINELKVRIGLHCGPLIAGVVGEQRLQYDVWGDTVNVASRMESTGEPGRIQVSEAFASALRPTDSALRPPLAAIRERGYVDVKGKGQMKTFWLEGA